MWHLDASNRLATIEMGQKLGRGAPPHFWGGELGPHLAQCGLDQGPPPCQVPSWSIHLFGHNRHGPKIGEGAPPPFWATGVGSPSNTKSPGLRPTSIPRGILIHPAIWPQQIWTKNWEGLSPFGGGGAGSPSNTMWPGMRPTCTPSFTLIHPTAWPQYTNITDKTDKQTAQRSDNTGRTILQTVVQKRGQSNLTYKAALPLHMNGSVIFARWCQCAPKNRKPTMVAMETSLRTSKLAMTSSDSLTPKTHL